MALQARRVGPTTTEKSKTTNCTGPFFLFGRLATAAVIAILLSAVVVTLSPSTAFAQTTNNTAPAVQRNGLKTPADLTAIQHIIFIVKENRGFDNMFGQFPGADGATTGVLSTGQVIPLGHNPDITPRDICHTWPCAITGIDNGKMDGWDLQVVGGPSACNINGDYLCYTQFSQADIPNYFSYASNFVLADHMFESIQSSSTRPIFMLSRPSPME